MKFKPGWALSFYELDSAHEEPPEDAEGRRGGDLLLPSHSNVLGGGPQKAYHDPAHLSK